MIINNYVIMNRYLVDDIEKKCYRCKVNEMIMVAIIGNIDSEHLQECIIFNCKDNFEKYLQEQIKDDQSIYARICKKYYDYASMDWQMYFLHISKNILNFFENLHRGNILSFSYIYLYNSDLIYEKIIGSNMKISKNVAIFSDARKSKYMFYDDVSEISQFSENCGGFITNVISTDDIKFYKKIDRINT